MTRAERAAVAVAVALLAASLVSLWTVPLPAGRTWSVTWEIVLGAGLAAAGWACCRVPAGHVPGRLFLLAGNGLLAAPPLLLAAAAPRAADVVAVAAVVVVTPAAMLRIVPLSAGTPPAARRAARGGELLAAGCGVVTVALVAAGAGSAAGWLAFVTALLLFGVGWALFEATSGDARRQLLWLVLGVGTTAPGLGFISTASDPWAIGTAAVAGLLATTSLLLPLTATIAVVAPRAVDVRSVISRAVVLAVTAILVIAAASLAEAMFRLLLDDEPSPGYRGLVTLGIALAFHPAMRAVRSVTDEMLFGGRPDPVDTLTRLGGQLTAGGTPAEWLGTLRTALAVPGAELRQGGATVASAGELDGLDGGRTVVTPLRAGDEHVGDLVVGVPADRLALDPTTRAVLELVAAPLAQALRAVRLSEELQVSRGRVVAALEEERRRVRRDLHDGLGPTLTGIAYSADAALNVGAADPAAAADLLRQLRSDAAEAIAEVRRIVYGLRPKALDELGLAGAVRQHVQHLRTADGRPLRVALTAPGTLPELPAAVEVAAYRVAVEAVTNVARHAGVDACDVELALADDGLHVVVTDAGRSAGPWRPGVGIGSMRERAESIGGTLTLTVTPDGARVAATLPTATAP